MVPNYPSIEGPTAMPSRTFTLAGLAAVLCGLIATGCSPSDSSAQKTAGSAAAPPAVTATPTPTSAVDTQVLPLRAFAASDQEMRTLSQASGLLAQDCMHGLGFPDWTMQPYTPTKQADTPTQFGLLDDAQAAQYGFHSAESLKGKPTNGPKLDPAVFTAESGLVSMGSQKQAGGNIPEGGCLGEADRKLNAGLKVGKNSVYGDLSGQSLQRTSADTRVVAATQAWSDCMKQKGYVYTSPQSLATESWGNTVTQREIDTARADVTCTKQTNLSGIALGVESAIQQQLIEQNREALKAERAAIEARIAKAAQVLKDHGQ